MHPPPHSARALIAITGEDAIPFLQGILTQDVAKLADAKIQFAALLSPQGKILHDMFLIDAASIGAGDGILLDTPALHAPTLLKRLAMYKLRAKVTITDVSGDWHITLADDGLPDPRHPQLPQRLYSREAHLPPTTNHLSPLALGIPESAVDFAPDTIVAMDAGYDLLHAISFTKGCYVGQEIIARMHYKQIARKGFYILTHDTLPTRLMLLRFEDVTTKNGLVELDGVTYRATLPEWMQSKLLSTRPHA
jgi:folate-binding protein YgfZ